MQAATVRVEADANDTSQASLPNRFYSAACGKAGQGMPFQHVHLLEPLEPVIGKARAKILFSWWKLMPRRSGLLLANKHRNAHGEHVLHEEHARKPRGHRP